MKSTLLFMLTLTALFGAGVTGLHLGTQQLVAQNQAFLRQRALVELFGLGDPTQLSKQEVATIVTAQIDSSEQLTDPETGRKVPLLKAYRTARRQQLIACAFPFSGTGFWDEISGYIAVDAAFKKTVGLKVLTQSETPGLGARIEESEFVRPFAAGLNIQAPTSGECYLYLGTGTFSPEPGTPQHGRTFDAVTGATQTSLAMERMLNDAIATFRRCIQHREAEKNGM